jgi:hypothetical protein
MGMKFRAHGRDEKCVQNVGWKVRMEETTRKI